MARATLRTKTTVKVSNEHSGLNLDFGAPKGAKLSGFISTLIECVNWSEEDKTALIATFDKFKSKPNKQTGGGA